MEPMTTLEVTRSRVTLRNRLVPMMTLASPMTTVPVPIEASKNLWCCAKRQPLMVTSALEIASPTILIFPLSTPWEVTMVSLSPTARSINPDLVVRYQSSRYFEIIVMMKIRITVLYCARGP